MGTRLVWGHATPRQQGAPGTGAAGGLPRTAREPTIGIKHPPTGGPVGMEQAWKILAPLGRGGLQAERVGTKFFWPPGVCLTHTGSLL
jgi:hypothetical protein